MKNSPISFIMPAYNCESTITESLRSIIDGNLSSGDEIVITNDGSNDGTSVIIDSFRQKYSFITVLNHKLNRGGAAARNTAVAESRNPLIFCLDSDNVLAEGSIKKLKKYLVEQDADVAAFQELHYFKNDLAKITHKWIFKLGKVSLADSLAGHIVPIASGNYLFKKESWLRAGGYPEFAGALDAWGFGFRQLATGSRFVVFPDSFYYHRHGHDSYWVRDSRKGNVSLTALQIIIPYLDQIIDRDIIYIVSSKGRNIWFEQLDKRQLRLKSGVAGSTGRVVNTSESSLLIRKIDYNLVKWLKGFLKTTS